MKKIDFIRITDIHDSRLHKSLEEYGGSFPSHEQREFASQAAIMEDKEYYFLLAFTGGTEVGSILLWETEDFIYVEHFYVYSEYRGQEYGSEILATLSGRGKTIILEIDPPVDAIAIRRKGFYERNGFVANSYTHTHPPYHKENVGHSLLVMTHPKEITSSEYTVFNHYLKTHVMGK